LGQREYISFVAVYDFHNKMHEKLGKLTRFNTLPPTISLVKNKTLPWESGHVKRPNGKPKD
jgi:hypothetical protein